MVRLSSPLNSFAGANCEFPERLNMSLSDLLDMSLSDLLAVFLTPLPCWSRRGAGTPLAGPPCSFWPSSVLLWRRMRDAGPLLQLYHRGQQAKSQC